MFSVEPADLSLLHVLFYAASAGGWDDLIDTEGGAQQDRIVGGSQLISLRMAEELGDRVRLELARAEHPRRPATRWSPATSARGRVIVALPPALASTDRIRARCSPATATSSPSGCRWAR